MRWRLTHRCDPRGARLADRHYSRQSPGTLNFTPPGRVLTLITPEADAVWATSWPFAEYVHRAYPGAWNCSIFRNESPHLSSELIREAVAATRAVWGDPPPEGMVTMIDAAKVRSRNPGYCYLMAGFRRAGKTKGGLVIVQLLPAHMPEAVPPIGWQAPLLEVSA